MPNAEGRMEITQEQIDEAEYDVRQSMTADDRQTPRERDDGLLGLRTILDALAAARAENERLRADLRLIASAYDDSLSVGEMSMRSYDMACVARRALAAQEGTR